MRMLFERYTQEVPEGEVKTIVSMNLVKNDEGDKERMLAKYYEDLLDMSKEEFKRDNLEVEYRNFPWHAATKQGTQPFVDVLESLD